MQEIVVTSGVGFGLPPMQYRWPSKAATPQLLRLDDMDGTGDQLPTLGSNLQYKIARVCKECYWIWILTVLTFLLTLDNWWNQNLPVHICSSLKIKNVTNHQTVV